LKHPYGDALMGGRGQAARYEGRGGGTSCRIWREELRDDEGRPDGGRPSRVAVDRGGGSRWVVVDLAGEELVAAALGSGGGMGGGGGHRGGWLFECLSLLDALLHAAAGGEW
jgi:hypothetical protein